ncbi:MAG: phage GP46 family protein [Caulobacteraceae bacterium]
MPDIATVWSPADGRGDWIMDGADLRSGADLETAVLISLFTDRQADPDDLIPDGSADPRGWWGDLDEDRPIGSKIWLRLRSKQTQATLDVVRDDILQALQWLLDDLVASAIDVTTEWVRTGPAGLLGATVTISRDQGDETLHFAWAWAGEN